MKFLIGIDPGYKNLGAALLEKTESGLVLVRSCTFNPSSDDLEAFPAYLFTELLQGLDLRYDVSDLTLERYVPYQGINTADAEHIQTLIGMIRLYYYEKTGRLANIHRALDWKTALVKALFKSSGFRNPSSNLDKVFSMAAAAACVINLTVESIDTDHEADAICLAAIPVHAPECKQPTQTRVIKRKSSATR